MSRLKVALGTVVLGLALAPLVQLPAGASVSGCSTGRYTSGGSGVSNNVGWVSCTSVTGTFTFRAKVGCDDGRTVYGPWIGKPRTRSAATCGYSHRATSVGREVDNGG